MTRRFDKDSWIRAALRARYIVPKEDGVVFRAVKADENGVVDVSKGYVEVKVQTHKATGRVYFNMSYRGFNKSVLVNRIIAWAFLPNPANLPQVNHLDGNKPNNAKTNLEWASASDNEKHAHRTGLKTGRGSANSNAKLIVADVLAIRASGETVHNLMAKYRVSRSAIVNIINRKSWNHV